MSTATSPTLRNKRARPTDDAAPVETSFQHEDGEDEDDEDDDDGGGGGGGAKKADKKAGRRKIKIEYINDKSRRHITFSKRKAGIMKKARFVFCVLLLETRLVLRVYMLRPTNYRP